MHTKQFEFMLKVIHVFLTVKGNFIHTKGRSPCGHSCVAVVFVL